MIYNNDGWITIGWRRRCPVRRCDVLMKPRGCQEISYRFKGPHRQFGTSSIFLSLHFTFRSNVHMRAIMQTLVWKIWIVDMKIKHVLCAEAADSGTELHQTEASLCEVSDFFHQILAFYIAVPCLNSCMLLSKLKVIDRWHIWVKVKKVWRRHMRKHEIHTSGSLKRFYISRTLIQHPQMCTETVCV